MDNKINWCTGRADDCVMRGRSKPQQRARRAACAAAAWHNKWMASMTAHHHHHTTRVSPHSPPATLRNPACVMYEVAWILHATLKSNAVNPASVSRVRRRLMAVGCSNPRSGRAAQAAALRSLPSARTCALSVLLITFTSFTMPAQCRQRALC